MDRSQLIQEVIALVGEENAFTEPAALMAYECDALSIYKSKPAVVVLPGSAEEVVALVKLCARARAPLVARGAGTGLSGGALPVEGGVLIVFTRMNRILEVDLPNRRAVVEPGVVNLHLTQHVSRWGYYYAPDPSSQMACSIGGNAAENSGGPHCLKYGVTTNHILGLEVVLPSGEVVWLGGRTEEAPGYDLRGYFIGSEGTLGIITKVVVRLLPDPEGVKTMLSVFSTIRDACQTVSDIIAAGIIPAALEMIDQPTIQAVERTLHVGYPEDAAGVLLIELDGLVSSMGPLEEEIRAICQKNRATEFRLARDEDERVRLWMGRKKAFGAYGAIAAGFYCLDGVVPRSKIADVLEEFERIGARHGLRIANVFHAGDGNLHPIILFDDRIPEETERAVACGSDILKLCVEVGGALTGEHGVGVEKLPEMPVQFSQETLDVMRSLRAVFDPAGIMNPGKVIPTPGVCLEIGRALKVPEGMWH
ncbi:MAG: FAD-linked oxidase C-terminal domain-containing protein [Nitrospinota bacterium]